MLGGCAFVLSWFGALIAIDLDHRSMRKIFIGFLIFIALWTVVQMLAKRASTGLRLLPWPYFAGLGSISGLLGGLFGVGSAVIATPVLTMFFGASQVVAQGLSLAIAVPTTGCHIGHLQAFARASGLEHWHCDGHRRCFNSQLWRTRSAQLAAAYSENYLQYFCLNKRRPDCTDNYKDAKLMAYEPCLHKPSVASSFPL